MNPAGQALLVFQLETQRYALHLAAVRRVLPMMAIEPLPGAPPVVSGVIDVAGRVLPVLDARRRFGMPARPPRLADVLILADTHTRTPARSFALAADGVLGVVEHPAGTITPAASITPQVPHVSGVVKLADGLVLIHDVDTFLAASEQAQLADALAAEEAGP